MRSKLTIKLNQWKHLCLKDTYYKMSTTKRNEIYNA